MLCRRHIIEQVGAFFGYRKDRADRYFFYLIACRTCYNAEIRDRNVLSVIVIACFEIERIYYGGTNYFLQYRDVDSLARVREHHETARGFVGPFYPALILFDDLSRGHGGNGVIRIVIRGCIIIFFDRNKHIVEGTDCISAARSVLPFQLKQYRIGAGIYRLIGQSVILR